MRIKNWLILFLLLLAGAAGYYGYHLVSFASGVQETKLVSKGGPTRPPERAIPLWGGKEPVHILLMGIDTRKLRPNEPPRSDTMMMVSIDPRLKKYHLFSILRDTYVDIPGYGSGRINAALGHGGPQAAMDSVSQLTGVPVDYYVLTDFEGFVHLIDAVGGVELEVEKDMRYHDPTDKGMYDIDLKKGRQVLDGEKALQYVRFRHDALSDYARTERQRKLMQALAQQLKSGVTVLQLPSILESVRPYVQTNLGPVDMLKLAALTLTLEPGASGGHQLPQPGAFRESNRAGSVLIPSIRKVQLYVQQVIDGEGGT